MTDVIVNRTVSHDHEDVTEFMKKFGIAYSGSPRLLPHDIQQFRMKFMQEELDEFELAVLHGDLTKAFDALLDLAYVVHGTAQLMGLPWAKGWAAVQKANMSKQRGGVDKRGNHTLDVCKPPGWVGPEGELRDMLTMMQLDSFDDLGAK